MRLLIIILALLAPLVYADEVSVAKADEPSAAESDAGEAASTDDMVVVALSLIGTPYKYGGTTPEAGFDCSGLVQYILSLSSPVTLPRRAEDMYRMSEGRKVRVSELAPGDLLFFRIGQSPRVNHVAVYIGESRFVHAPSRGGFVRMEQLDNDYWQRRFLGARRILQGDGMLFADTAKSAPTETAP